YLPRNSTGMNEPVTMNKSTMMKRLFHRLSGCFRGSAPPDSCEHVDQSGTRNFEGSADRGFGIIGLFFDQQKNSNLPLDEWTETFGSERLTGALLERLTHHVSILEMNGESYRLAQSRARKAN